MKPYIQQFITVYRSDNIHVQTMSCCK